MNKTKKELNAKTAVKISKMKKNRNHLLYLSYRKSQRSLLPFLLLFFLLSVFCLLTSTDIRADTKPTWRSFSSAGKYITAITWDKYNNLWVAGEEFGVSLIPARPDVTSGQAGGDKRTIKTFDIPYCYTILCDNIGRVWIGSLRQGLYCYQYGDWTNYNTSNGLPSNSVHALAVDKYNTLYCAAGLSLSKLSEGKWEIISLPNTLPQSEISCMDFDQDGNLWVGFSLGGVAKFNGSDWKVYPVRKETPSKLVYTQEGGLGGDGRVNDILVARDGTIWVATCKGISRLKPETGYWQSFVYSSEPLCNPQQWGYSPANYFLKIAEDNSGNILFANRHAYIIRWGDKDSCLMDFAPKNQLPDSFVYCITIDDDDYIWAGTYGGGITTNNPTFKFPQKTQKLKIELKEAPQVEFSKTPYQKKLISQVYELLKNAPQQEKAYYIGEDWLTQGNWIGNYGEYAWILPSYYAAYPLQNIFGGSDRMGLQRFKHINWNAYIGENSDPDDTIRGWELEPGEIDYGEWENPRVLQDPLGGGRHHAVWDDHAESYPYPLIREGPHIYLDLDILEEGVFIVSFYFVNNDSHEDDPMNRFRDYTISVKKKIPKSIPKLYNYRGSKINWKTVSEKEFEQNPVLASCRVHDFRAGVYKSFMLKGPGEYTIKIGKKESFNTIVSGIFIDKVEQP